MSIMTSVQDVLAYVREALVQVLALPLDAFVGLALLAVLFGVLLILGRQLISALNPTGGTRLSKVLIRSAGSPSKDPYANIHGDHLGMMKSGQPAKLRIKAGLLGWKTIRVRAYKRWKDWDADQIELDPETYARICPEVYNDSACEISEVSISKDNSLWSHPSLEIRLSVRMTVVFFVISVAASILIEWLIP